MRALKRKGLPKLEAVEVVSLATECFICVENLLYTNSEHACRYLLLKK
jgi:hypothetical protein